MELELIDFCRALIKYQMGDVAVGDAWKVERINQTKFRVKPGEAWYDGLPFFMRSATDPLVSGNNISLGIVPTNTTIEDDPNGTGKIVTMNASVANNTFRVVIQAKEEVITNLDDPFLKNANLSESTAQKLRLNYIINIVSSTDQLESPVPYKGDSSADKNLVNEIVVNVGGAGSAGSLVSSSPIAGSEQIDGRDLELTIVNASDSNPLPKTISDQSAYSGGKLIDNVGNEYYIVSIFNDPSNASTREIIRIDKEVDQPDPTIGLFASYTLVKRDVFSTDDVNGTPIGRRYYPVADIVWKQTNGMVHDSVVTDLRQVIERAGDAQETAHTKFDLRLAGGGTVTAEPTEKATGSFEITDYTQLSGDIFELRGVNFVEGVDFNAIGSNADTAAALAQAINDSSDPLIDGILEATVVTSTTVLVSATSGGTAANSYTISYTDNGTVGATVSGATLTGGVDATLGQLLWTDDFQVVNPHGVAKSIVAAGDAVLRDGGALAYILDYGIGIDTNVEKGTLAVTTTNFGVAGTTITLSGAPDLSLVKIGNTLLITGTKESAAIVAIDDVAKTLVLDDTITASGAAIIYKDTYAPGTLPLGPNTFVLAVKTGNIIQVTNGVGLESGESTSGAGGVPQQLLDYIGSTGETDDSPNYSSVAVVGQGDDLTLAISKLDEYVDALDKFYKVNNIDLVSTALPNTASVTVDGVALSNGDRVLFTDSGIEGIYQVSNLGISASWSLVAVPTDGSIVSVQEGSAEFQTLWQRSAGSWKLANSATLEGDPTGFPNRTDTTVTFDDGTRTLTVAPVGTDFEFYIKGKPFRYEVSQNIVIPNLEGVHFVYFDGTTGALASTQAFSEAILRDHAYVAVLYWDAANSQRVYFGEERHGLTMDHATHLHFHTSFGAQYTSGLDLTGFSVDGDGSLDAHSQFTSTSGSVRDEDILNSISAQAQIPILYRSGSNGDWRKKTADNFPVIYSGTAGYGGARLPYNEWTGSTWQLTQAGNDSFVLVHFFGTNDKDAGVIGIQGQAEYADLVAARAGAADEIKSLSGLPFQEFTPIGTVIFRTNSTYANTTAAAIYSTESGEDYVDFRGRIGFGAGSGPGDHGSLSGLNDPDHGPTAVTTTGVAKDGAFSSSDTDLKEALDTLDKTLGTLRLKKNALNTHQVDITGALRTLNNSDQIDQVIGSFLMDFAGETIDFTNGTTVGTTNIIGLADVVTEIPTPGDYKWFSIGLLPDSVNVTPPINRMVPQIQVNPAISANSILADAPLPFMVGDVKLGAVLIQRVGTDAVVVEVNKLGVGSGSGGSGTGDANSLFETYKNQLMDSNYEFATINIFSQDEDAKLDLTAGGSNGLTTDHGTYSLVSKLFEMEAGKKMVSAQLLDSAFIATNDIPATVDISVTWELANIDTAATYKLCFVGDTQLRYETVTMTRIGDTDTYVGTHTFSDTSGTAPWDLRLEVTSPNGGNIQGFAVFYDLQTTGIIGGIKNRHVFGAIDPDLDPTTFTLNFLPDPDLLSVYVIETGQVLKSPSFSLNGRDVVFPAGTFLGMPQPTITLVFDQLVGSSFDNSDNNAALLAANFLGSADPNIDRSQNGRGIFLRRPDGTLRELTINNNDDIEIFSV